MKSDVRSLAASREIWRASRDRDSRFELLTEIDAIMEIVGKAKLRSAQVEALINDMYLVLANTREEHLKAAYREILNGLQGGMDASQAAELIRLKLGDEYAIAVNKPVYEWSKSVYKLGQQEIKAQTGIRIGYGIEDEQAVKLLHENNIFYIGQYYDSQRGDIMQRDLGRLFAESLSQRELADKIAEAIDLDNKLGKHYFQGFVRHAAGRVRNVSHAVTYERIGVEYAEVVAILDAATTEICQEMNGRLIPVKRMRETAEQILNIDTEGKTPDEVTEELKAIVPFWNDKETGRIKGMSTEELLTENAGLDLPPYHWGCRTTTVAYFEEEGESYQAEVGTECDEETENYANNLTDREIGNKIQAIREMERLGYRKEDLASDWEKHYVKDPDKWGQSFKDEKDYAAYANSVIKEAEHVAMHMWNKAELQFDFIGKGCYVVANGKMEIVGMYPQGSTERLWEQRKNWVRLRGKNG